MYEPVDGRHGGHRVLEDLVPLAEDQVRGDDDGLFLVAFGEEGEEHFHFLAGLVDVADIVEDDGIKALEFGKRGRQFQVALGGEQLGHEFEGGSEKHLQVVSLDPLATEGSHQMRFTPPWQAEAQQKLRKLGSEAKQPSRVYPGDSHVEMRPCLWKRLRNLDWLWR